MANKQNKKAPVITIIVVAAIVILAIVFINVLVPGEPAEQVTREEVGEVIEVPEPGSELEDKTIAIPEVTAAAAPGVEARFRRFFISIENDRYVPSEVIVNTGDTVHIDFTAVDKTYDITLPDYGMKQIVATGETKIFEFQAVNTGKFLYYCDLCGGVKGKVTGHIIVVPRQ
ncbi:cupredoxin domain-containing protein [Patescibacteria group bacterium AH-259-L05]|nr:cupredoxin domain-containing protein [Patescibacteria group bacterium AH-259-L05]